MSINLTATNQKLKLITSAAVQTQVVASGRDNASSVQTPISQDTNVTTATTTDIVAVPGASTQRLVDDVEINIVGSGTQQVTVQKDVGGTVFQLFNALLGSGERAHFTNDMGWRTFNAFGVEKGIPVGYSQLAAPTVITAAGAYTFNPPVGCTAVLIELVGGGGQGGGSGAGVASNAAEGSGGSAGCYTRKFLIGVPNSITGTVGAGGSGAAGTANGNAGAATTAVANAVTYTANGGPGGLVGVAGTTIGQSAAAPAAGSVAGTNGDESYPGETGRPGLRLGTAVGVAGRGGGSFFAPGTGGADLIHTTSVNGNSPATGAVGAGSSGAANIAVATQTAPAGNAGMARFTPYSG